MEASGQLPVGGGHLTGVVVPSELDCAAVDSGIPSHETFRQTRHFASLDGLRCLSIVPVVWHHMLPEPREGILGRGAWGVSLFFAISGFLITTLLLRERESRGCVSLRDFYARRSLRIFPLYYAVLALFAVHTWCGGAQAGAREHFFESLQYYATYTSNWFVDFAVRFPVIFAFAWSLATEEQFYLTWPWAIRISRGPWIPVLVMTLLLLIDQGAERGWIARLAVVDPTLLRIMRSLSAPICMGSLLAVVVHWRPGFATLAPLFGRRASAACVLVALSAAVAGGAPDIVTHVLMAVLVVSCCLREDHVLRDALTRPAIAHVGKVSYGIYLMHVGVIGAVRWLLPNWRAQLWLAFLLVLGGSVLVASLSFHFFERPILSLRARYRPRSL